MDVLSSTFSSLLSKLDSCDLSELLNSHKHVRKEVPKWRNFLPKIHAVLEDAEQKRATNKSVKLFLDDLRDLAFDIEDILDKLELDAKRKLIASPKASTSVTHKLTPKWVKDRAIASQMKNITARLQQFEGDIRTLGLNNLAVNVEASSSRGVVERLLNSAMPEPNVVGRESDKEKIFQMFDDEGNHEGYSVIPIVGMGGLGKTTLAGLIYNDEKVKDYGFELNAWAYVSDVFDVDQITRVILQQVTGKKSDVQDLFSLQQDLKKELSGKKFLLVLDDIWNENRWYERWDVLQRPFSGGAPGSKIIITTRNMVVATKTMRAGDKVYNLDFLPEDECLPLFARHALDKKNFDSHRELEGVGREIVKKCRGLPLAVIVLGGLLRGKQDRQQWEALLDSELCNLPEGQSGIHAVQKHDFLFLKNYGIYRT